MAVQFLNRFDWGADPRSVVLGAAIPHQQFVGLVIHHTVIDYVVGGDAAAYMRRLQRSRPDLGLEVPYSFVIFETEDPNSCIVAEGRGWGRSGAHTVGYNSTSYGIALAGNFTDHAPTAGMLEGIRWIGRQLYDPLGALATIGHRDTGYATACPGDSAEPLLHLVQPPFTEAEEDMALSEDDVRRIAAAVWERATETYDGFRPAANVVGLIYDQIVRPDLLVRRVAEAVPASSGTAASARDIAQQTMDLFHERLSD